MRQVGRDIRAALGAPLWGGGGVGDAPQGPADARFSRGEALLLVATLGLGMALRFHRLDALSVWLDEAITWERSILPLPELFDDSVRRLHNPAYFTLMHYVLQVADDEWMLRLPSALFGCGKLVAVAVLGRVVGGPRVSIGATLFLALSPSHLHYDQEARMYAWFTFAVACSLCGLLWVVQHPERARRRRAWPAWSAYVLGATLALYAHNTAVFYVFCAGLVALLRAATLPEGRLRFLGRVLLADLVVLLLWSPWLKFLFQQTTRIRKRFWAKFPDSQEIERVLRQLYLHELPGPEAVACGLLLLLLSLWALRRQRVLAGSLLLLSLVPPALVLLVSLERPIFLMRIMLWATIPLCVLLACGLSAVRGPLLHALLCLGIAVGGVYYLNDGYYAARRKPDWTGALRHVVDDWQEGAVILLIGGREKRQVRYYFSRKTDPLPWRPYENLGNMKRMRRMEWAARGHDVIWAIYRGQRDYTRIGRRYLDGHGRIVWRRHWGHSLHTLKYEMGARR